MLQENLYKMSGEFFIKLYDNKGCVLEERHFKNIIVNTASLLVARLLADKQTAIDSLGPDHGLWVLAVGSGHASWDKQNPPEATITQTKLESEMFRKRFSNVTFIRTDGSGLPSNTVTNILEFQTVFTESEAVGPLVELGLFGGGGIIDGDIGLKDMGTLLNYRTTSVINKSSTTSLAIVFRLTT